MRRRRSSEDARLPAADDVLWRYMHSIPLAGFAQDDELRTALESEVVARWQPFTEDGSLVLEVDISVAAPRK